MLHGTNLKELQKQFDVDALPDEMGGTLGKSDELAKVQPDFRDSLL